MLVALNTIWNQQAAANESTNESIDQILKYLATYANDGIVYRSRKMVISAHSYAGFHNESKFQIQSVFLEEDESIPRGNEPILTFAQVIISVISSAAEAALGAIFITSKEFFPMRQTLIEMGWSRPPTPIQIDTSTAAGVVNDTIIA